VQGGPFTAAQAKAFERLPHAEAAIRLRRWDDHAKVPGRTNPPISEYEPLLLGLVVG